MKAKCIVLISLWIGSPFHLLAQTPSHRWYVVDNGGGKSTAGSITLKGSMGQHGVQKMSAGGVALESGYLPGIRSNLSTVAVSILAGWNMISSPVTNPIPGDSVRQLFPTADVPFVYEFTGTYVDRYTLANGKGYWGHFPSGTTNLIRGTARTRDSISVVAGWNMVGTISNLVDTSTIVSVPPGLRASPWYGFPGTYTAASQLVPGQGYWVRSTGTGKFVLGAASLVKPPAIAADPLATLNSLTITDSTGVSQTLYFGEDGANEIALDFYSMPPPSPLGTLDARFSTAEGGSMVRTHALKASDGAEFPVTIQSGAYPLTVTWKVSKETESYQLTDGLGGRVFRSKEMRGEGSMKITNGGLNKFSVRLVGDGELPKEYALDQNYPNPFNPSTTIKYDLPKDSRVSLQLFNILGQEVATLVNGVEEPGYKFVQWSASGFASGVYFYRLQAGSYTATKKLVVLR